MHAAAQTLCESQSSEKWRLYVALQKIGSTGRLRLKNLDLLRSLVGIAWCCLRRQLMVVCTGWCVKLALTLESAKKSGHAGQDTERLQRAATLKTLIH